MRITTSDPITYVYRDRFDNLHILRRPSWMGDAADNNRDWLAKIRQVRSNVCRPFVGGPFVPPSYENLLAHGKPIRTLTSPSAGRSGEIANVLARLWAHTDDPRTGHECYIDD
ncbi:MAG TPA: hypothetical protein VG476_02510 [Acidimicrobiales bacterium]|nr:hypothetical protein [Acidimicrobiales bacterium]